MAILHFTFFIFIFYYWLVRYASIKSLTYNLTLQSIIMRKVLIVILDPFNDFI